MQSTELTILPQDMQHFQQPTSCIFI